jgi:hypothetical protein
MRRNVDPWAFYIINVFNIFEIGINSYRYNDNNSNNISIHPFLPSLNKIEIRQWYNKCNLSFILFYNLKNNTECFKK